MSYTRFFTGLIERRDNATDSCWVITFPPLSLMAELIAAGTLTIPKDILLVNLRGTLSKFPNTRNYETTFN